ncbi:oligosaccharide flippase family protein [Wenyingzhuangia sp. 2_MG-2023]|uniref:oligosaccharide flippase family protein n=1 Tax=Wenyingzhuangia sp. 2_MG-2023 TaxID=3062639 RepID=UPI0026E46752|nr:oligosaccharide flippase family protein [Wenyingzhuangia sp. 2_MG-2023]MDO6736767.1 oligosaccharide flippase family protein [Wenyingzhuangia sp. 2_MG-2023]
MSTLNSFLKNTVVYGLAAVLPKAINVFLVGFHTQNLASTVEFNVNTQFFVWAAYFNVLLTFGMETTFFKFFNSENNKQKVLSTSFTSVGLVTLFVLTPLFLLADKIAPLLEFAEVIHFKTLVGILAFDTLVVIPFAYLRVNNKAFSYAGFRIFNISIYAFLNLLFLWYLPKHNQLNVLSWYPTHSNVGYIFLATLLASSLTFLMVLPSFLKFKISLDFKLLKKMLSYGWPILIAGLAYVTNENLDKLILPQFLNESIGGAYAGTYKLGVFMALFITAFKLGAEPFFFNISKNKNAKNTYAIILEWFTILGALIVLVIVAYIDFFASLLLKKPEYHETLAIVPVILLANLLLGIYNNLSVWYKNTGQTKFAMYFSILGAVFTIVGLLVFVPIFGYIGAAWVTFFVYFLMMMVSYLYGQKYYKTPYNVKKIGALFLWIMTLCFVSFYIFRNNFWINTSLLLATLCLITFSERKFITQRFLKR